jgi:branched-chain amino acid transport system ATP-binding protein
MRDIHRSGITLVIVEHIMEVIMSLVTRVVVFPRARRSRGSPREVTGNPAVIAAYSARAPPRPRGPHADRADGRTQDRAVRSSVWKFAMAT